MKLSGGVCGPEAEFCVQEDGIVQARVCSVEAWVVPPPKTPHPYPFSHRPPFRREKGTRLGRSCLLPLFPDGGRAMGEEGRGDEGSFGRE